MYGHHGYCKRHLQCLRFLFFPLKLSGGGPGRALAVLVRDRIAAGASGAEIDRPAEVPTAFALGHRSRTPIHTFSPPALLAGTEVHVGSGHTYNRAKRQGSTTPCEVSVNRRAREGVRALSTRAGSAARKAHQLLDFSPEGQHVPAWSAHRSRPTGPARPERCRVLATVPRLSNDYVIKSRPALSALNRDANCRAQNLLKKSGALGTKGPTPRTPAGALPGPGRRALYTLGADRG